jgi:hypothetical protein
LNLNDKSNEQIKEEVLLDLYQTGRINGEYFSIKSKSKANPIMGYINRFLKMNGLTDPSLDLCNECYQTVFQHLWAKTADKIVSIINEAPSKLTATALRIAINQCFSIKPNSGSGGVFQKILDKSAFQIGNAEINTNGYHKDEEDDENVKFPTLIIYEDASDLISEFEELYGFTVEEVIERMTPAEKEFFYYQLQTQRVGKPSKTTVDQRKALYNRIIEIKKQIEQDNENR